MIDFESAKKAIEDYNKSHSIPANRIRVTYHEWLGLFNEAIKSNRMVGGYFRMFGAEVEMIGPEFYGDRVRHQPDMIR